MAGWQPDILGPGWVCQYLDLPPIRGERVRAALVTEAHNVTGAGSGAAQPDTAVLYLHGFNDYFFQTHVARFFADQGLAFFALDLHGYGRATGKESTRNDCWSLREYGPELGAATRYLLEERGFRRLIIHGHSTGALIASLWSASPMGRATVAGLILNSPWLELNRPWFDRVVGTAVVNGVGGVVPAQVLGIGPSPYAYRLHRDNGGAWDFDLNLKRARAYPVRAGWLRAIREAHARLHDGLGLAIPIFVASANRTGTAKTPPELLNYADTVLDVEQIAAKAHRLGDSVELVRILGGIHDLALGTPDSRRDYFAAIERWLVAHEFSAHTDRQEMRENHAISR